MKPIFHLIDLPLWPGAEDPAGQFRIAAHAKPWRGVAVYASPTGEGFSERNLIAERAVMGELTAPLAGGPSGRTLEAQRIELALYSGELESRPLAQILNGANMAMVKSPDEKWEVIQFLEAEEIGANRWRLSSLLRGQLGTESAAKLEKPAGTPFILFDGGVQGIGLTSSEIGLELNWRIGAAGKSFSDEYFDTVKAIGGLQALKPLSPVHLKAERLGNGDLSLNWIRRGRIDADNWMGADIALGEDSENYRLEVWQAGGRIRTVEVSSASWTYPSATRLAEVGTSSFEIRIAMLSTRVGAGDFASIQIKSNF